MEIDFISNAEGRQSSKLTTVITNIGWFFVSIALFAVLGCFEWIDGAVDINWEVFKNLSFWGHGFHGVLTHAYLCSEGRYAMKSMTQEEMCEWVGWHADQIAILATNICKSKPFEKEK